MTALSKTCPKCGRFDEQHVCGGCGAFDCECDGHFKEDRETETHPTAIDIAALKALLEAAAPLDWCVSEEWEDEYADDKKWRRINSNSDVSMEAAIAELGDWNQDGAANASLIVAAVNALPELLAVYEAACNWRKSGAHPCGEPGCGCTECKLWEAVGEP